MGTTAWPAIGKVMEIDSPNIPHLDGLLVAVKSVPVFITAHGKLERVVMVEADDGRIMWARLSHLKLPHKPLHFPEPGHWSTCVWVPDRVMCIQIEVEKLRKGRKT